MSWFKKTVKKIGKTLKRASRGKFHINPFKGGRLAATGGLEGLAYRYLLPAHKRRVLSNSLDWGRFKKRIKKKLVGNNSAASVYYVGGSSPSGVGYVYSGRRIGDMY